MTTNMPFVNRHEEMDIIKDDYLDLLLQKRAIRKRFVEIHGISGIGKTSMLRHIEDQCKKHHTSIFPIWTDANRDITIFSQEVIKQVQGYGITLQPLVGDTLDQSIAATRELLQAKGPIVFFIDSLDTATDTQLTLIENMLYRFTEDSSSKLVCIMASKRMITFEKIRPVTLRLKTIELKPFARNHCATYMHQLAPDLPQDTYDLIYKWTGGYPLAVNVLIEAVQQKQLDLTKDSHRQSLIPLINDKIIKGGVLADVDQSTETLTWYETMLTTFSVPRRFNLSLMQEITERFVSQYKLTSSLGYMQMQRRFNRKTDVLNWNQQKSGYALDAAIRPILITKLKIERPEHFKEISEFLARENRLQADAVTGTDRIRYLMEHLYHRACYTSKDELRTTIEKTLQLVFAEPSDSLNFFKEELEQDEELLEELQELKYLPFSLLYQHLAESYWQLARDTSDTEERLTYLQEFFGNSIKDPTVDMASPAPAQYLQQIKEKESVDVRSRLFTMLSQDAEIIGLLSTNAAILSLLVTD